jgi:hypothetical protein
MTKEAAWMYVALGELLVTSLNENGEILSILSQHIKALQAGMTLIEMKIGLEDHSEGHKKLTAAIEAGYVQLGDLLARRSSHREKVEAYLAGVRKFAEQAES